MVPIPEGVERSEEEPQNETYPPVGVSDLSNPSHPAKPSSKPVINPTINKTQNSKANANSKGAQKIENGRMTLGSGEDEDEIRG